MSEFAVMPMTDYKGICDKLREKTDTSDAIKSGEVAEKIDSVYEAGETNAWALAESLLSNGYKDYSYFTYPFKAELVKMPQELIRHTASGSDFKYMFSSCSELTEVPQFGTPLGTNFSYMFSGCSKLTEVPYFDTSRGTNLSSMFSGCSALESIPPLNFSSVDKCEYIFQNCKAMKETPDVSLKGDADYAFYSCSSLSRLSDGFDCSEVTSFSSGFRNTNLVEVPSLSLKKIDGDLASLFDECSSLEKVGVIDLGSTQGAYFRYSFSGCSKLHTIEGIRFYCTALSATGGHFNNTFTGCSELVNLTFDGQIRHAGLNLAPCPKLSHDSLMSVINALYDYSSSTSTYKVTFGSENLAKLTEEEKLIMDAKGWTYA